MSEQTPTLQYDPDTQTLICAGDWRQTSLPALSEQWSQIQLPSSGQLRVDGSQLTQLDTSGAWFLQSQLSSLRIQWQGIRPAQQALLELIDAHRPAPSSAALARQATPDWLSEIGANAARKFNTAHRFLAFLGALVMQSLDILKDPRRLRIRPLLAQIDQCGYQALPIVALLSFLIGVVLSYQMGTQLKLYGADVFIVQLVGLSVLREFAPLITAIIVIGRTGSAFTAQIGIMKINQEIDALQTSGVAPFDMLIIPRLLGLMVVLPLLIVWADLFGMLGGALMSKALFDMSLFDFFQRLREDVEVSSYFIGLSKAPVFATLIALVGCFRGLQVAGSAQSVGHHTTRSVVQAIFLIIIADAGFSILYSWAGI